MTRAHKPRLLNVNLLPPQLRMIVRTIGEAAALRLVEHMGGTYVIVPVSCKADHPLMELLGPQAFAALVAEYKGITLQLPKYDSVARQWRHQQVHALLGKGLLLREVAQQSNYSLRHVINIAQAQAEAAGAQQLDLFGADACESPEEAGTVEGFESPAHNPFGL